MLAETLGVELAGVFELSPRGTSCGWSRASGGEPGTVRRAVVPAGPAIRWGTRYAIGARW